MLEPRPSSRSIVVLVSCAVVGLLIAAVLLAVYRIGGGQSNAVASECAASKATAVRLAPLASGEVAAVGVAAVPQPSPALRFEGPDGKAKTLVDFKGRALLLNLWATWCVPCRNEMPSLDRLQAQLGSADFEVVAVDVDTSRLQNRRLFLAEAGIKALNFYADPSGEAFQTLRLAGNGIGLPTSLLIDKAGCTVASISGPADWSSPDAIRLVNALIDR
jgi:thiol-disulfide isomerase/thioredoxin